MLRLGATFIQDVLRTYVTLDLEAMATLNALRIYTTLQCEAKVTPSALNDTMIQPVLLGLSDKGPATHCHSFS